MKIVIAPDKFKDSLTGFEFCNAVEEGLKNVNPNFEILKMPLADGGDGSAEVVRHYLNGDTISISASDPLFRAIPASYLYNIKERRAFIEMATVSGLQQLALAERNCMHTTTLGTGELIVDAIERGATQLILGIGGSATNDGGMGLGYALGFRFLDSDNNELQPIGSNLIAVEHIDFSQVHTKLKGLQVTVACDVDNLFFGKDGAAFTYAAQKGASATEIKYLDDGLRHFAEILQKTFHLNVQNVKGAGAAGGLGGGSVAFLNAKLVSGISMIKELSQFEATITNADWIITGEGKLDSQTLSGKTIAGVLESAKQKNVKVAALCGQISLNEKEVENLGFNYLDAISTNSIDIDKAIKNAYPNLLKSAEKFGILISRNN